MREMLYPWMPIDSFIKPHIFYRLSETARHTLKWKAQMNSAIPVTNAVSIDLRQRFVFQIHWFMALTQRKKYILSIIGKHIII